MIADNFRLGDYGEEYVKLCFANRYHKIKTVPHEINVQLEWGDIVLPPLPTLGITTKKVEVKTEWNNPAGNFFMERWSNRKAKRDGWVITSPADELYYLFWNEGYGFRFPCWQQTAWMIDYNQYNLKEQKKTEQHNDTWGYIVPIHSLKGPFAPVKFDLCKETMNKSKKIVDDSIR